LLNISQILAIIITIIAVIIAATTGIHKGAVTHHQDHAMRLVSLRVRNIRNSTVVILMLEDVLDDAMFE
jgi:ABC-type dipeptide/oligopeptide/nickel transport system permease subunit